MKYSKRTIKKENENRSLFLFPLYSLCFMLYIYTTYSLISNLLKRTIKKENENRSLFLFLLYSLCFMLYTLQIISASQKLFANTKLPEDILQQIVIRYLPRNLT